MGEPREVLAGIDYYRFDGGVVHRTNERPGTVRKWYPVFDSHADLAHEVARLQEENTALQRRVEDAEAYRDLVKGRVPAMEEVDRLRDENAALHERDADTLLTAVLARINADVIISTDKDAGKLSVEWTRVYDGGEESGTRTALTSTISNALRSILNHEDGADALDAMGITVPR